MKNKRTSNLNERTVSNAKKLAISGIVIALYISIMFLTQSFAFGQYQIRVATSLYSLAAIYPFLILPLGIANFLSNTIMGGLGPFDMLGGLAAGIVTAFCCFAFRKINTFLVAVPIIAVPTLLVPLWLQYLLGVPYWTLVLSIGVGQVLPGILGILIVKYLEKPLSRI